jgi:hypothetical protein
MKRIYNCGRFPLSSARIEPLNLHLRCLNT